MASEPGNGTSFVIDLPLDATPDGGELESFGASGLPTYIVFRDGVEVDRLTLRVIPLFLEQRLRGMITGG